MEPRVFIVLLSVRGLTTAWALLAAAAAGALLWSVTGSAVATIIAVCLPLVAARLSRPAAYLTIGDGRLAITAGPARLELPFGAIDPTSIERRARDGDVQNLQGVAAASVAGFRLGWHENPARPGRYFLATNGEGVMRFRTTSGVHVALSLAIADQDRLAAAIASGGGHAATMPDME